jgi:hypothetical protein
MEDPANRDHTGGGIVDLVEDTVVADSPPPMRGKGGGGGRASRGYRALHWKRGIYEDSRRFRQRPPNSLAERTIEPDMRRVVRSGVVGRHQLLGNHDSNVNLA